jgi:iron complex outermembrane receptor protein
MITSLAVLRPTGPFIRLACAAVFSLGFILSLGAAEAAKKNFNLPAGDAATTLKAFTQQSGEQIVYPVGQIRGVKTNVVQGEFAARDALDRMLDGTGLVAVQDEKTGALAVRRDPGPNVLSRRPVAPAAVAAKTENGVIKLETVTVLGSRIHQTETVGPSPVMSYDIGYIRSTGALTVADFLGKLPQTYGGISAGRGSAPSELNLEFGQRSDGGVPPTGPFGSSPLLQPLSQTGVSGVSLRSLGSGSTLVLVDGRRVTQSGNGNRASVSRQGFVDLNTIPLGLVERIEIITDGASAVYGADAVAGVINVVLRKNWTGTELSSTVKFTEHGGAHERQATLTTGFTTRSLRALLALEYYDRSTLFASQRDFAANMDHRSRLVGHDVTGAPVYGTDQRIKWGYVSAVQAFGGNGEFTALPGVRVVLTPEGSVVTPALGQFIPRTTAGEGQFGLPAAQGQRQTNVSEYLQLVPRSERYGVTGNFTYTFANGLEAYGTYGFSDTRGFASALPPYNNATPTNGRVLAAYNPFGQDVLVGMIHLGFGPESQTTHTSAHSVTLGLRGQWGTTWRWDAGARWQQQDFTQRNRRWNSFALVAAMANADPTLRFNPFLDYRVPGAPNPAAIYEQIALHTSVDATATLSTLDFTADGELAQLPGGALKAAFGGSYDQPEARNTTVEALPAAIVNRVTTTFDDRRRSHAAFAELSVPVFGQKNAVPLLRRLDFNLAGRYEDQSDTGSSFVPKYGLSWVPFTSLLFRASYSEGFRPPSLTENQGLSATSSITFGDPRRGDTPTTFTRRTGPNPDLRPEVSTNEFYGLLWEPSFAKGLSFQVNYYRTHQKDAIQPVNFFVILSNETLFPGRVTRTAPTPTDTAAGWPGAITEVVEYTANFGEVKNESLDFVAEYVLPWQTYGRWRIGANASHTLESSRALVPGEPPINDVGDTYAGPKWKGLLSINWTRGPWSASVLTSYLSGFKSNTAGYQSNTWTMATPAMSKLDLRGSYEFKRGVWRHFGKGLRLSLGVENVADREPPFMDVIYGYNAALHSDFVRGRTYELSFSLPL